MKKKNKSTDREKFFKCNKSIYLTQMQNPGEGRHTELVLTNVQTDDQGLEVGALFKSETTGNLKIAVADISNLRGNSATSSVGSVTVTV